MTPSQLADRKRKLILLLSNPNLKTSYAAQKEKKAKLKDEDVGGRY